MNDRFQPLSHMTVLPFMIFIDDVAMINMCAKIGVSLEDPQTSDFTQFEDRFRTYINLCKFSTYLQTV